MDKAKATIDDQVMELLKSMNIEVPSDLNLLKGDLSGQIYNKFRLLKLESDEFFMEKLRRLEQNIKKVSLEKRVVGRSTKRRSGGGYKKKKSKRINKRQNRRHSVQSGGVETSMILILIGVAILSICGLASTVGNEQGEGANP